MRVGGVLLPSSKMPNGAIFITDFTSLIFSVGSVSFDAISAQYLFTSQILYGGGQDI